MQKINLENVMFIKLMVSTLAIKLFRGELNFEIADLNFDCFNLA